MASLFNFTSTLRGLNNAKKYRESLKYYYDNISAFSKKSIEGNTYVVSAIVNTFRYTRNLSLAFEFLEEYEIKINENTDEIVLCAYGWLLYDKYKAENHKINTLEEDEFKNEDDSELDKCENCEQRNYDTFLQIVDFIELIARYKTQYSDTLFSKLFSLVLIIEKNRKYPNWELVNDFCDVVPFERLTTDTGWGFVKIKGKTTKMEMASDFESWYCYKSKALLKLGRYQECADLSHEALSEVKKFHYGNDIYLKQRIALCTAQLGDYFSAISLYQNIIEQNPSWYSRKELALLYIEVEDYKNAFIWAIQAINGSGDLNFKLELLCILGALLLRRNEIDLAFKHYSLFRIIRINKGKEVPEDVQKELEKFEKKDIPIEDLGRLKSELMSYWNVCWLEIDESSKQDRERYIDDPEEGK